MRDMTLVRAIVTIVLAVFPEFQYSGNAQI
jgi:hypothetical protein